MSTSVTSKNDDSKGSSRGVSTAARIAIGLGVAVVAAAVFLAATFVYSISKDQRKDLDVTKGFGADVYLVSGQDKVADTTQKRVCARLPKCVQSAESSRIRIMRFDSKAAAGAYVLQLAPYGYHSDWFVVEFLQPETMTRDEYRYVESSVYGTASDSPD